MAVRGHDEGVVVRTKGPKMCERGAKGKGLAMEMILHRKK